MSSPGRFKPYSPGGRAVVRLEEALPPEHPIHVFVDLVHGGELRHFVIPPGPKGEKPYHPHALFGIGPQVATEQKTGIGLPVVMDQKITVGARAEARTRRRMAKTRLG